MNTEVRIILTLSPYSSFHANKQTNDSNDFYLFKYFSYLLWFTAIRTVLVVNGHQNIWFYIYGSVQWKWQIGTCFANHCFLVSNTVCISHVTIIFVFFILNGNFLARACWSHVFLGALEKRHAYFSSIRRIYLMTEWDGSNDDCGPKKNTNVVDIEIKSPREKLYRIIILFGYIFYLHKLPVTISTQLCVSHSFGFKSVIFNTLYI